MTRSTTFPRAVAALAGLALAVAAFMAVATMGPAQASPGPVDQGPPPTQSQPQPQPTSVLFLSVTPRNSPITSAILFCDPPGGLHQNPAAACADIATADGDFTKLPGREGVICDDIYDPVIATAFGWWRGRLVWFRHTAANACELYGTTGAVFPTPITVTPPRPTIPGPTVTFTVPRPTIPGPTVTIDPPDTTIPN